MSGSDLAPFVAAVLRDSTVVKLKNENDGLRELLDERLRLQITGQDGSPIHYETSMKNGSSKEGDNGRDLWEVMIGSDKNENTFDDVIPLNTIGKHIEIWVGGQFLQRFDLNTCRLRRMIGTNDGFDRDIKDKPQMGLIAILPTLESSIYSSVPIIYAVFGPILFDEYHNLPQQMNMRELIHLSRTSNNGTSKNLMIMRMLFRKSKIRGVISMLEKLGITTTTTTTTTTITSNKPTATAVTAATTVIDDDEEDDNDNDADADADADAEQ
ncbi:MAG: hypothetical protein ACI8RD_009697 [Bacillariaceae sp.]|jgi:hypothetical protein